MIKRFLLAVLLGGIPVFSFSQSNFEIKLQDILNKKEYINSSVGIQVTEIESGLSVFEYNPTKLMIPASTLKIVTSAAALEMLGAGYRFKTQIGYVGDLKENNELNGDLVIVGGGDPTLGSMYFNNSDPGYTFINLWVQRIKAYGIHQINGDIIFDSSIYDTEKVPSTWIWGDIGNYYGAGANAFTCFDNLFRITFKSDERAGELTNIISTYPKIDGMEITNEVTSSENNSDNAYVFGSPFDKKRVIRGTIPKGRNAFTIKAAVHHPEEIIASELKAQLAREGVFYMGEIKFGKPDKSKFNTVYVQESPTLAEIVKVLNHESVNLFAEHLVKQIAAEKTGIGNREKGIELITEFWKSKGIFEDDFFMEDGSGLSHFNAISPNQITSILIYMIGKSSESMAFLNSLPNAGSGTLSGFSTESFPENTLKAKSGSMTRVRCYAGFLQTNSDKEIAFSIMFNQFSGSGSKLTKEIENLLFELRK
ncbi:MAG TPA: D-alanyl-D-alanine carboxypeptidase/D-alanyl-D-alanine-endopeptidase [Draconibacterium sp.]|nr:D-alanyl-D-alanine carboxypeptidase/D-alanyl-D-alanine-endopeptidase [Draconibacterium sp.]